ncbi:hypothetical protein, conserved [Trypanosoma brucei gambiense DAL972]|uniref:Uncharacterized protein n=1 Tax=Trypanosoma brucei gambiense (strain MHOM/CI/86/DAL972) TaxID=679716 RepID=D0A0R5_TRYB9|nr:hypothetical protein, conserved [Trypanosoma brucei gambiense DAL972]CBH16823.1 hypothetical protein, conserved [Trypanosoma brucei gambiense DAL972]|eukprot:XP_011779087.1 hypothetical protein, conserved [Trypanosoma brucei gambiense DAL972]
MKSEGTPIPTRTPKSGKKKKEFTQLALAKDHRFNWMGHDGTESETLNLDLLRITNEGCLRFSDQARRDYVITMIRARLGQIKLALGLCTEEDLEDDEDEDDDEENSEAQVLWRLAVRRVELQQEAEERGDSGEPLYYGTPTEEEVAEGYRDFVKGTRVLLSHLKQTFVSYIDGREFNTVAQLVEHNNALRPTYEETAAAVQHPKFELPPVEEFDAEPLQAYVEKRNECRMKIDALRCCGGGAYAMRYMREEELDEIGTPRIYVDMEDTEATLDEELQNARQNLAKERWEYNCRAARVYRRLQKFLARRAAAAEQS